MAAYHSSWRHSVTYWTGVVFSLNSLAVYVPPILLAVRQAYLELIARLF
jgi:hypothetical protein